MNRVRDWWTRWQATKERVGRRVTVWCLRHLPAGVVARPMEWFLAIVCTASGLAIALGVSRPQAAHNELRPITYYSWSATLVIGGAAMMIGLSSIHWLTFPTYTLSRVAEYQFGLRLLWVGCAIWSGVLIANSGIDALLSASFAALFSATCAVRTLTVGSRI